MSKRKISNRKLIIQLGRDESIFALWDKSAQIIHSVALPTPIGAVEDGMIQNPMLFVNCCSPQWRFLNSKAYITPSSHCVLLRSSPKPL